MRILIVSDNHGEEKVLSSVIRREVAEHVIHCGDFCTDADALPNRERMTVVRGNCDFAAVKEEEIWEGGGYRFFVTHGHRYGIKSSLTSLLYRAEEVAADIVCFGHSHTPYCSEHGGCLFVNPGSVVQPRGYTVPTYAVLETGDEGGVDITYYTPGGELVPLGGTYSLKAKKPE